VLSELAHKAVHYLKEESVKSVQDFFYENPDVSRCCHGMKDAILLRVKQKGQACYVSGSERSWQYVLPKTSEQLDRRYSFTALHPTCVVTGSAQIHVYLALSEHEANGIICNMEVEDCAQGCCNLYPRAKPLLTSLEGQNNI
jgi:hypothetical protein